MDHVNHNLNRILSDFNGTAAEYPKDKTVHRLFEEQAEKTPDSIAVVEPHRRRSITYRSLNRTANRLANGLRARGAGPNTLVGIMVERSIDMVAAMLGILKSGAAYLPIDPGYPEARKKLMIKDSGIRLLLDDRELRDAENYPGDSSNPEHINRPGDLLYVIYTSGSTGIPKGVPVNHGSFVNLVYFHRAVFGEEPGSRFSQAASIGFDAMAFEVWPCLLSGAGLYITDDEVRMEAAGLKRWLIENCIEIAFFPTLMAEYLLEEEWPAKGAALKAVRAAGDRLGRAPSRFCPFKFYNLYGPTEDTVWTTWTEVAPDAAGKYPPIGKPVGNHRVYIVAEEGNMVVQPIGAPGELCIAGVGVARGYLNRPELTAEKFVRTPGRIYRTGDLARWLPDGNIEFLGRIDQQVKIRGYRIELGEIETRLLEHPGVKEAVVAARENMLGDKYLCAYVVKKEAGDVDFRTYLAQTLPDYMIPAYFTALEKIPLTANGKVDIKALPEPGMDGAGLEYTAPRDELEKKLTAIWAGALGMDESLVGIDNDFFQLGGHSLTGTLMISRLHRELAVRISLAELFAAPSVREMAAFVRNKNRDEYSFIEPVEEREYYPLSPAQERLYIMSQMELETINYNTPAIVRLEGNIDRPRLEDAFFKLIERHESARTGFQVIGDQPVQSIRESVEFALEYCELSDNEELSNIIQRFVRPFDLVRAPLLRAALIKETGGTWLLAVDMHHIISDGMSFEIFKKELAAFYDGGEPPPLRVRYRDYARWQREEIASEAMKRQEAYWLREFSGEVPAANLPLDYARPAVRSFAGNSLFFELAADGARALRQLAKETGATLFMVLLALFDVSMAKLCGQEEIVVGTPLAGRRHADLRDIIGMFINTLAIKTQPAGTKRFDRFLAEVKQKTLAAFENQEYPFEYLVEKVMTSRDPSRNPLFDAAFALQNMEKEQFADTSLEIKPYKYSFNISRFDLVLFAEEDDRGLSFTVEYCTRLFKEETIKRFVRYFKRIAAAVLKDPGIGIAGIEIVTDEEKKQLLFDFNDTAAGYPVNKAVHRLFEAQAQKAPQRTAVVFADQHLTYGELNEKAHRLAGVLRAKGVGTDTIAGVMIDRSPGLITGLLAVLKAGGAYLPIDPALPGERKRYMLADSSAVLLLTDAPSIEWCDCCPVLSISGPPPAALSCPPVYQPGSLAYVIYTSGTTGKPKGVLIEHRSLVNLCLWHLQRFGITGNDRASQYANTGFDAAVWEIFPYLVGGAALHILDDGTRMDIEAVAEYFERCHITAAFLPTPVYEQFMHLENRSLRVLLTGGDKLRNFEKNSYLVINNYGPTESTVVATSYPVERRDGNIPIGRPIHNTTAYILDRVSRHLQPVGLAGELCIGGLGLARGYLNRPALTAEKFVTGFHKRIYLTGDLARWQEDGNIQFLGRIDQQVKIRGYRIEPGEIEARLLKHPGVKEAVVQAVGKPGGDKFLCAYFVPRDDWDGETLARELKTHLSASLPDYMIPAVFAPLENIPLTPHGKVDSKALPLPGLRCTGAPYAPPVNEIQRKLVELWAAVLELDRQITGIDDNFFDLGGHSLKGTVIITRIHREFNIRISLSEMFRLATIRKLAAYIEGAAEERCGAIENVEEKEYYDLSYAQRRLWILCQFEEDSSAYNIPGAFMVSGKLDAAAYGRSIQALVQRHESLRTAFITVKGEPKQRIVKHLEYRVRQEDLRALEPAAREERARELFIASAGHTFDLEQAPLCLFNIVRLEDEKYLLIINIHHIVNDGWSHGIIYNELFTLYNVFAKSGENPLRPLTLQYKDYTGWHNRLIAEGHFSEAEAYWLEKFKDKPNGVELPLDHLRKPVQTFNGRRISFVIDQEKTRGLYDICSEENATLFMGLLALCCIFLYKYTAQRDIILGAPIANRKRTELNSLVGFFVNTLVYRVDVEPGEHFRQLLRRVRQETLDCYEYQDYPFDLLINRLELDRDLSQSPLFNVMLAHNNSDTLDTRLRMEGLDVSDYPYLDDINMSKFDLIFFMDEVDGRVEVMLEYNSDLFEAPTIGRMVKNFLVFFDALAREPETPIPRLNYIHKGEYEKITHGFNSTGHPFSPLSIQQLFQHRVQRAGDKIAVVHGAEHITYDELNKRANRLAWYLRDRYSVKPGDIAGLSIDRSLEMIIAVLAVIKSGAGYVAIDPNYPEERVEHMLTDSRAGILIIDRMRPELFGDYRGAMIDIYAERQQVNEKPDQDLDVSNQPSDILYVIYTSGSTGTPNGAMLSHGILANLIRWQMEKSPVDASLRCLQFTSVNFCVSFQEIMITLISGGELHLIGDIERQDVEYLMAFLGRQRIELLYLPFSYLNFLFNESGRFGELYNHYLKHIVTAGEQLKITSGLRRFLQNNPGIQLHNHYGSSEMHVVTSYTLDASTMDLKPIPPAGTPIANTKIYILDDYFELLPIGVWGELFVEGASEVLGYINNSTLTGQKLLDHPKLSVDHKRLYRSGDLGRWLEDGNIELKGRKDTQIKIRGFRVELGEIESKVLLMEEVRDCVVVVKEEAAQKHLVAYVVGKGPGIEPWRIKEHLAGFLPQYMIPRVMVLERLPLMPNGKVDREKLPEPGNLVDDEYKPPRNKVEKRLAGIWSNLLGIEAGRISIDANFFDIGGHSLKATLMLSAIHQAFNVKVLLTDIFRAPTIGEIAQCIVHAGGETHPAVQPAEKKEYYTLSPAQKRMYILRQLDRESVTYNLPQVLLLQGELDVEKLERVFQQLTDRHESFRTSFITVNGEPFQAIRDSVEFAIEHYEVEDLDAAVQGFTRPFDLSTAPLLRVGLGKTRENQYLLMVDMHHIISDGASYAIFTEELMQLYSGNQLPPLNIHYKDYSEWHENVRQADSATLNEQETFWLKEFETGVPVLEMPTDYQRPRVLSFEGRHLRFEIGGEDLDALRRFNEQHNVTLFITLLAVFYVLLAKTAGQEDIVVGVPVLGRRHPGLHSIIGMFVNTLALRNNPASGKTFKEFLLQLKERSLRAFDNEDYPLEDLVDKLGIQRQTGRGTLFDVMFALQNMGDRGQDLLEIKIPGLRLKSYDTGAAVSRSDLCLYAFERSEGIDCILEYGTRLFKAETMEIFKDRYLILLGQVLENPGCPIEGLDYRTGMEKELQQVSDVEFDF
jgi:amino acid adenylation domain-containing protein